MSEVVGPWQATSVVASPRPAMDLSAFFFKRALFTVQKSTSDPTLVGVILCQYAQFVESLWNRPACSTDCEECPNIFWGLDYQDFMGLIVGWCR